MKTTLHSLFALSALAVLLFSTTTARADSLVLDPVGDFLPTYAGPKGGDLDVVSTNASLLGTNFVFSATLNAPVGSTSQGFYIWGVDRGTGASTSNFAALGLPNIIFDAVVRINPDGTGLVNLLAPTPPAATPLPVGSITFSGNSFQVIIPVSMLPSRGFSPGQYTQNLWPRWGGAVGNAQISDFAPNANNASISTVPEPATMLLLGTGLAGLGGMIKRKRQVRK